MSNEVTSLQQLPTFISLLTDWVNIIPYPRLITGDRQYLLLDYEIYRTTIIMENHDLALRTGLFSWHPFMLEVRELKS